MRPYAWKYMESWDKNNLFLAQNDSPRDRVCTFPLLLGKYSYAPHYFNTQYKSNMIGLYVCAHMHVCMYTCVAFFLLLWWNWILPCPSLTLNSKSKRQRGKVYWWSQALESLFPLSFLIIQAKRQPSLSKLVQIWSVTYNQNNSDLCNKHGHLPKGSFFTIKFVQFPNIFISWSLYVFE